MESPTTNESKSGGRSSPLSSSEWVLATTFLLLLGSFIVIAKVNAYRAKIALEAFPVQEEIFLTIDGAVKKPGKYQVQPGTSIEAILRKARPALDADLKSLPFMDKIDRSLHITVNKLDEIRVNVTGAIAESADLLLPPGSRICDLKSKIIFTPETELRFFRRKKLLKDGDKIEVPKKTVE